MIEPDSTITEYYGVLVGRTLVDTSNWSATVLVINPGSDVVVLPSQVSAVTVAQTLLIRPEATPHGPLPPHLEDIVAGSHRYLGVDGHSALTNLLHMYNHVFPAPGDPVTSPSVGGHITLRRQGSEQNKNVSETC